MPANDSIAWTVDGEIALIVSPYERATIDEHLTECLQDLSGTNKVKGCVVRPSQVPQTPKQRAALGEWFQLTRARCSVLSSSTYMQHITTVLGWFGGTLRVFPYPTASYVDALSFAGVPAERLATVEVELKQLIGQVDRGQHRPKRR